VVIAIRIGNAVAPKRNRMGASGLAVASIKRTIIAVITVFWQTCRANLSVTVFFTVTNVFIPTLFV